MPNMRHRLGVNHLALAKLVVLGMLVQLLVIGYVFWSAYESEVRLVETQRAGCERGKLDRRDSADFQGAHTIYIVTVTGAKSVREDVKRAARKAVVTFERTSNDLVKRSKINCANVYPKASLLP